MINCKKLYALLLLYCLPFLAWSQRDDVSILIQTALEEQTTDASTGKVLASWLLVYNAVQEADDQTDLPEVCITIANIYRREQLFEQALPYYLKALNTLDKHASFDTQSENIYQQLAETYANLSKPDSAYYFYNIIFDNKERSGNFNGQINILHEMAKAFMLNKQYSNALESNLQIKQLLEANFRPNHERLLIYNNLGYNYNYLKQYKESISYFEMALKLIEEEDHSDKVILNTNIGIAYYNLGDFATSIDYLSEAKNIKNKYDHAGVDEINQLLATVYLKKKDLHNALEYSNQSEGLARINHNDALLTDVYYTTALIYSGLYEYDTALDYFQKHLELRDSFALEDKLRQQQLLQQQIDLERTEKQIKLFIINEDIQKLTIAQLKVEAENQQLALQNKEVQLIAEQKEKELLQKENEIRASKLQTQELETQRARQELELTQQRLIASQQQQEVTVLQQKEALQQLEIQSKEAQLTTEKQQNDILLRDKEINVLELDKQKGRVKLFYGLGILMILIIVAVAAGLLYSRKLNQQLSQKNEAIEHQKEEITAERIKSDQLLLNILPEETAQELKEKGFASPKRYDNATVLFTDFSGFTRVASTMSPEQLIEELNYCFRNFDAIIEKHGMEKIKTIGDSYMCVSGLPVPVEQHSHCAIRVGTEINEFMNKRIAEKEAAGQDYWQMRIGIHSGPVVAGVVGDKKFAYDIWGDTVNIASRMESNGENGKINISEDTYQLVKDEYSCEARGKIMAKNLGEVNMYFVN